MRGGVMGGMMSPEMMAACMRMVQKIDAVAEARVSLTEAHVVLAGKPGRWIRPPHIRRKIHSLALDAGDLEIGASGVLHEAGRVFRLDTDDPKAAAVPLQPASDQQRSALAQHVGRTVLLSGHWRFVPDAGYLEVNRITTAVLPASHPVRTSEDAHGDNERHGPGYG